MLELKAKGHDEGDETFEERLPIAKQPEIRRFTPEIDGDGAVFSRRLSRYAHVSPPGHQVFVSWGDTMGVTRCNLKPIVKGSGRYHQIRWNVFIFNTNFRCICCGLADMLILARNMPALAIAIKCPARIGKRRKNAHQKVPKP